MTCSASGHSRLFAEELTGHSEPLSLRWQRKRPSQEVGPRQQMAQLEPTVLVVLLGSPSFRRLT